MSNIITLKHLLKRGVLRIFPKASTLWQTVKRQVSSRTTFAPAMFLTLLIFIGCATPKQVTQLVNDIQRDTIYLSNIQYDSICIFKDRLIDRSKDTVYLKDVSVEYRYKLLRDTIKVIQRDSVPYEVTVIETKEITRPLTAFDKTCRASFFLILGILFVRFVRLVFKLKKHLRIIIRPSAHDQVKCG